MAKKKKEAESKNKISSPEDAGAYIAGAGQVVEEPITLTLEKKLYALRNERYSFQSISGNRRL